MKKFLALLLALTMALCLAACGNTNDQPVGSSASGSGDAAPSVKVGFICLHDENSTYDLNFINGAKEACEALGITDYVIKTNIAEDNDCLVAAEELAQEGIELLVYDLHTIKPLDEEAVINAAKTCGAVVTAEEHQLAGGLFGAVSETLVQHSPVPMEAVAVRDTFGESGAPEALMDAYGLNAKAIVQAVRRVLARKG